MGTQMFQYLPQCGICHITLSTSMQLFCWQPNNFFHGLVKRLYLRARLIFKGVDKRSCGRRVYVLCKRCSTVPPLRPKNADRRDHGLEHNVTIFAHRRRHNALSRAKGCVGNQAS